MRETCLKTDALPRCRPGGLPEIGKRRSASLQTGIWRARLRQPPGISRVLTGPWLDQRSKGEVTRHFPPRGATWRVQSVGRVLSSRHDPARRRIRTTAGRSREFRHDPLERSIGGGAQFQPRSPIRPGGALPHALASALRSGAAFGRGPEDAQDLTQECFARLLAKGYLAAVHPEKGKSRWFLLAAAKRFLNNEQQRALAEERGGGVTRALRRAEGGGSLPAGGRGPPDTRPVVRSCLAVNRIEAANRSLEEECALGGKAQLFKQLKVFLSGDSSHLTSSDSCRSRGTSAHDGGLPARRHSRSLRRTTARKPA